MRIGGQHVLVTEAVLLLPDSRSPSDSKGKMNPAFFQGKDPRIMELMAFQPLADGKKRILSLHF